VLERTSMQFAVHKQCDLNLPGQCCRMDAVPVRWRAALVCVFGCFKRSVLRSSRHKLYGVGRLFACRHCYRLAYTSQQESVHQRGLWKSQQIRMRLGGSASMLDEFPDRPKGMHWRTYERWCRVHDAAEERSTIGLMGFVERLGRRSSRRA